MTAPSAVPEAPGRRRLGNRREHELVNFEHAGIAYTAGFLSRSAWLRRMIAERVAKAPEAA
jgi:hypothetical protein